jgi:hypothetical protein
MRQKNTVTTTRSAVPDPIRQLVALFAEALPDVLFPEVDAQMLASLVRTVEARAETLAQAEADLAAARQAHAEAHAELTRAADKGLGYARVFAADDPALSAKLTEIVLGRTKPVKRPKTRSRRTRSEPEGVTKLPFASTSEPASGAA